MLKQKQKQTIQSNNSIQKLGNDLDFSSVEAYNLLRTNLSFAFPGKTNGKIIGITSASPSEGKSFTSINLAYSLAKDGKKVLLIDSDMRKPSVAEKLHIQFAPGLSNLLADRQNSNIQAGVLHTNMSVLTAGDIPPNPSELIGSDEMNVNLKQFAEIYDYVLVDLPPIMEVSDPLIMAKYLDGIILVVLHDHSYRSDVREAVRKLQFIDVRILGFVYNGYSAGAKYGYKKYAKHYYKQYQTGDFSN